MKSSLHCSLWFVVVFLLCLCNCKVVISLVGGVFVHGCSVDCAGLLCCCCLLLVLFCSVAVGSGFSWGLFDIVVFFGVAVSSDVWFDVICRMGWFCLCMLLVDCLAVRGCCCCLCVWWPMLSWVLCWVLYLTLQVAGLSNNCGFLWVYYSGGWFCCGW